MTVLVLLFLVTVAVQVSLPNSVDHTDPVLHHAPLGVHNLHSAEKWRRFSGDWTLVAGHVDSPADGRASWMHGDRPPLKKHRSRDIQRSTFIRAAEPPRHARRSRSNVIGVTTKARRPGFPRSLSHLISHHPQPVPDDVIDVRRIMTAADNDGQRRKSSPFSGGGGGVGQGRPRAVSHSHPVYLGIGNDAVDAAYTAYVDIVAPSARNQRTAVLNPVTFVGK